jgi:hypothetical protein
MVRVEVSMERRNRQREPYRHHPDRVNKRDFQKRLDQRHREDERKHSGADRYTVKR